MMGERVRHSWSEKGSAPDPCLLLVINHIFYYDQQNYLFYISNTFSY